MTRISAVLTGLLFMLSGIAHTAEITVLSGGAVEPGLNAAAAAFQKQGGHTVKITYNTAPAIRKRVSGGDVFDIVIAPPAVIKEFAEKFVDGGINIGKVGSGVAVRPGAPVPDISSADAVKRAVTEAESVVYNRASTGIYIENMLKKMGVYDESRTVRYPDAGAVMEHLLKGKGKEIGFGPITEILLYKDKGLRLIGPLPAEIQNFTSYAAVPMSANSTRNAAQAFVGFLGGAGKPLLVAAGIE